MHLGHDVHVGHGQCGGHVCGGEEQKQGYPHCHCPPSENGLTIKTCEQGRTCEQLILCLAYPYFLLAEIVIEQSRLLVHKWNDSDGN